MTIHQIECFCALAKYNSFTKAAESMYLSQPAFSRVISGLETEMGCTLYIREKGNPRLSEKGEQVLPHMRQILEHYTAACSLVKLGAGHHDESGTIVLGVFRFGMMQSFTWMTAAYKAVDPKVRFDMVEHTGVSIFPALKSMDVDLIHTNYIPAKFAGVLDTLQVGRFPYVALLPSGHPLAQKQDLRLEDLAGEYFVGIDRHQFPLMNSRLLSVCADAGFSPNIVREFDTLANIYDYIAEGRAVTVFATNPPERSGIAAVPLPQIEPDPTYLVWAKANEKPELHAFLDFVRAHLEESL